MITLPTWELEVEIADLKQQLATISKEIGYPDEWDTGCYPTLASAVHEIYACAKEPKCP